MIEGVADAYALLGLARNPFVAEQEPGVARELWLDRGLPDPPAAPPRSFVQVIGEKGAGKTSHLCRWRHSDPGPYRHVEPGIRRFRPLPAAAPLCYWDEADRVPEPLLRAALRSVARRGGAVRCGTHRDLAEHAVREGFAVVTYLLPPLDPGALHAWVARRVAAVALPDRDPAWELAPARAAAIAAASGASWRDAATALHVEVARCAAESRRLAGARPTS